jgi:hypothetical protein
VTDLLKVSLGVAVVVANKDACDKSILPGIQVVDFSNRDIKLPVQPVEQRFQPAAFLFKRSAACQVNVEG